MAISIYPSKILEEPGLLAFYRFETNSTDWSGNGNGGASSNALFSQPPALLDESYSVYLNGTNAYVNLQNRFTFPNREPFTIEFWAYPVEARASGYQALVSKEDLSPSPDAGWSIHIDNTNKRWGFTRYDTSSYRWATSANNSVTLYQWTYVVATYDGTNIRLYINGSLVSTQNAAFTAQTTTRAVNVGRESGGAYFNGNIDELAFYSRALAGSEILEHYNARSVYYTESQISVSDSDHINGASSYAAHRSTTRTDTDTVTASEFLSGARNQTLSDARTINRTELFFLVTLLTRADNSGKLSELHNLIMNSNMVVVDNPHITYSESLNIVTDYPPILNLQNEDDLRRRANAVNKAAQRYADGEIITMYHHIGIFDESVLDVTNFLVANHEYAPLAVGTVITNWQTGSVITTVSRNVYQYTPILLNFGINLAVQG